MSRRAIAFLSLLALAGCKVGENMSPAAASNAGPALNISDGAHTTLTGPGNPDFFFLPPMVPDPSHSPNWDKGAFNGKLNPIVDICQVDATTEAQVNAGAPCKTGGYFKSFQLTPKDVDPGSNGQGSHEDDDAKGRHYHVDWKVPDSRTVFYRLTVHVGTKVLGFADIETSNDDSDEIRNTNTGGFVKLSDGRNLPVNFRIEQFALCDPPGQGPCTSQVVNLAAGGTVTTTLPNGTAPTGVTIPPQGSGSPPVNITVQTCPDLNNRATDLPTFGSCIRITSDPPLPGGALTTAATVFICDLAASVHANVASENQEKRITLHRLDTDNLGQHLSALPHTVGCPVASASAGASVGSMLRELAQGHLKSAGSQALTLLGPKPLYAFRRRLDQGGGGVSLDFSDFQFALPSKMLKDANTDNQTASAGTLLPNDPKVFVTDLGGEPVKGARVTFGTTDGSSVAPTTFVTGADGVAHAAWTLRATAGANSMKASGRGIAGADFNGPRLDVGGIVDPFQPIQAFFDGPLPESGPVQVLTGSQTFNATGVAESTSAGLFDFGSGGFSYKVIGAADPEPTNWTLASFDAFANGFTLGASAAFGEPFPGAVGVGCGNVTSTDWPLNTDILVRKKFTLAAAGPVQVQIAIDNDIVNVTMNGAQLNSAIVVHEGCAARNAADNLVYTVPGLAGLNVLAIHARDRGGESYLDVKVGPGSP